MSASKIGQAELDSQWNGTNSSADSAPTKSYKKPVVKISGRITFETERAVRFNIYQDGEPTDVTHWIPLSQIEEIHREYSVVNAKLDSMVISQWIADTKGI